ncbi:MAG: glycosyltransferase family 4 protein [bacterium]
MRLVSTSSLIDDGPPMRVHFAVHHHRDRAAGASGATLALGDALELLGCQVSYFFFDDAFREARLSEIQRMLRFPWRVARHLATVAKTADIVDATTGDAWVWCRRGRPGGNGTTLVTRAHGLEHVSAVDLRQRAMSGQATLSWKYSLYHGGFRLWEVRQSMAWADGRVFLNSPDREYAGSRLGIPQDGSVVLPNGVPALLLGRARVTPDMAASSPIALAFVGSWIPRKGTGAIVEMASVLHARGRSFSLRLLGTGMDVMSVMEQFAADVRPFVTVTPSYTVEQLAPLLHGATVLLHPSWTEGFSLALVEGMACGLAPVASRSGGATDVVIDGETGLLLTDVSGASLADAVMRLSSDREMLSRLCNAAQARVQQLDWRTIARKTIEFYRATIHRRAAGGTGR